MTTCYVIGFDPGGTNAFGWAALYSTAAQTSLVTSGTCSNAPDALHAARSSIPFAPHAFAVDAPLFWVPSGDRSADQKVRNMVCAAGGQPGTVSHVNSLRGACLVQGILVTLLAAEAWPEAKISEAHPKALRRVSSAAREFAEKELRDLNDHELDAGLAAFAAVNLLRVSAGWHDLADEEKRAYFPTGHRVAYWFPQAIAALRVEAECQK